MYRRIGNRTIFVSGTGSVPKGNLLPFRFLFFEHQVLFPFWFLFENGFRFWFLDIEFCFRLSFRVPVTGHQLCSPFPDQSVICSSATYILVIHRRFLPEMSDLTELCPTKIQCMTRVIQWFQWVGSNFRNKLSYGNQDCATRFEESRKGKKKSPIPLIQSNSFTTKFKGLRRKFVIKVNSLKRMSTKLSHIKWNECVFMATARCRYI